jgi:hypothetical protein
MNQSGIGQTVGSKMLAKTSTETGQLSLMLEPERRVFRVSDLNAALQRVVETDFHGIFVAGEISGCRRAKLNACSSRDRRVLPSSSRWTGSL